MANTRANTRANTIVVIGSGIAGLSAAWELTRLGHQDLVILEASPRAGGVMASLARGGFVAEEGPDSFLTAKPAFRQLCRELGLEPEIIAARPQAGGARVLHQGQLQTLPAGWRMIAPTQLEPVLESPLFSAAVKQEIAQHWAADPPPPQADESIDESIAAYLRRRFGPLAGQAIADTVAGPMAAGVYGGDAETLAVPTAGPAPPAPRAPLFGSLRAGMGSLTETLMAALPPGSVHCGCPVNAIRAAGDGFQLIAGAAALAAAAVIVATPAWAAAPMLATLDPALAAPLAAIPYSSSLNLNLAYTPAPPLPEGYGFLVPRGEGFGLLACTFAHQKFPHRAPEGSALLRVFYAGETLALDDAEAVALAQRELASILGLHAPPLWTHLRRAPRSLPLYTVGHRQRLQQLNTALASHPRLALAGSAYGGVGVPDCIASGRAAATRVAAALA